MATTSIPTKHQRLNVADRLTKMAQQIPDAIAVACPGRGDVAGKNSYTTCTFAQLDQDATALARGLVELGVQPGTRLVLLVRPGVEFVKLVFALLRSGATTVLIDPGMSRKHLINGLASTDPEGFIAISPAQAIRTVLRKRFPQATKNVTVGRRWFWGGKTYEQLRTLGQHSQSALPETHATDPAAIIFTSGSTGPPKGVSYSHQMFDTQATEIGSHYDIHPGGADLACFPLFGLFNSAMGVTTVFPDMDFSRPASADPAKLLAAAHDWQVTQAFASPAVWRKLSTFCKRTGEMIPTLRKVLSCGAPVPAEVLRRTLACVSAGAEMHTPYGATECLPVASIAASEVFDETARLTDQGAGICVGRKFTTIDWRVISITDDPIASIDDCDTMPVGEIGELVVRGPQVSPEYVKLDTVDHNPSAKIRDADSIWHRMGDVGYLDEQQRFWYCGRKAHRVETAQGTMYTIPCESIFNTHQDIARSALVGVGERGEQIPVLIIEASLESQNQNQDAQSLCAEAQQLATKHELTQEIKHVLIHSSLPVDVRHNSKINREQLAAWATEQLGPFEK
ncbi:MAG: AMP-binding protein [Planctomycetes bacterium]|nr:AMP-binding protein [Planctomycetota bacterium]